MLEHDFDADGLQLCLSLHFLFVQGLRLILRTAFRASLDVSTGLCTASGMYKALSMAF